MRLGEVGDKYERRLAEYQVTYTVENGDSFARVFTGDEALAEFLRNHAALPEEEVERVFAELRSSGTANAAEVEIPRAELAPLGMIQDPSA